MFSKGETMIEVMKAAGSAIMIMVLLFLLFCALEYLSGYIGYNPRKKKKGEK